MAPTWTFVETKSQRCLGLGQMSTVDSDTGRLEPRSSVFVTLTGEIFLNNNFKTFPIKVMHIHGKKIRKWRKLGNKNHP